jgi:hypothetical protein
VRFAQAKVTSGQIPILGGATCPQHRAAIGDEPAILPVIIRHRVGATRRPDRVQRMIQYSRAAAMEPKGRGVLNPRRRGDDNRRRRERNANGTLRPAYSWSGFLPPMVFSLAKTASTLRSSRCFSLGSNSGSLRVVSEAGSRVAPP